MKKPIGILTARMGSSRVPGKAMMDLAGKPMIGRIIDRMRAVPVVDRIILATSTDPRNEPMVAYAKSIGVDVYQHPDEEDMVARIFIAIEDTDAETLLVTGGDCPLIEPELLSEMLEIAMADTSVDFVSPRLGWTYPVGLSADVLSRRSIELCHRNLRDPARRYEIGIYIRNSARFNAVGVNRERCLSHYMWTVDWPEDVAFMQRVFSNLQVEGEIFTLNDVLTFLEAEGELFDGEPFEDPWPLETFQDPWPA